MKKINLLKSLPKTKRSILNRSKKKNLNVIKISRQYGKLYFDGPREYGYGGFNYDGRWKSVAKDIIKYYKLKKNSKVLDVGCAKGFLVKDLFDAGMDAFGIDISRYAIKNCHKDIIGRVSLGNAKKLIFPNNSFDLVISLNTIHNLEKKDCIKSLQEIQRITKKNAFIQVDSYKTKKQKEIFEKWVLTAKYHDYPNNWIKLFKKAGYKGDYYWTIIK